LHHPAPGHIDPPGVLLGNITERLRGAEAIAVMETDLTCLALELPAVETANQIIPTAAAQYPFGFPRSGGPLVTFVPINRQAILPGGDNSQRSQRFS